MERRKLILGGLAALPAQALAGAQARADVAAAFQPVRALLDEKDPITWVFTGDSITHGAEHTLGWRSYPEHFAERVRWELRRKRDMVVNSGISGDRLPRLMGELDWRVMRFRPRLVSLMMGMNDCVEGPDGRAKFRASLEQFSAALEAERALLLLHTPNLIFYPLAAQRKDLPAYVDIIRDFARKRNVALVDHYREWSESRKTEDDQLVLLAGGAIHPNQYGHIYMAQVIFRRLGIFDPASPVCRLFVP